MQATAGSHVDLLKRIPKKCIRCRHKIMTIICSILGVSKAEEYSKTESTCGVKRCISTLCLKVRRIFLIHARNIESPILNYNSAPTDLSLMRLELRLTSV